MMPDIPTPTLDILGSTPSLETLQNFEADLFGESSNQPPNPTWKFLVHEIDLREQLDW